MPGLYMAALLVSVAGLATIDHRYKLALFYRRKQALTILMVAVLIFVIWDAAGIAAGIFWIGENNLLLGLTIGEFPVEELAFLFLLNYSALVTYTYFKKRAAAS